MPTLIISLECKDPSDLEWLRHRVVGAVEDVVADADEDNRLDDECEVSWDIED